MIVNGITYRPGFLLNTVELCGLVHLPSPEIFEGRRLPVPPLETLVFQNEELSEGIHIGNCNYAETEIPVCIPHQERMLHLHLIGSHGMGKSTVFEHACLQDIERGDGIAVLDPHGDLVERLLGLIRQDHSSRVIYFDPGDRNWVPLWNPLTPIPNQDIGRTADDLVKSFKTLFDSGWGHRLEHILRYSIISLLNLSGSTFNDLNNLFRKDEVSDELQQRIFEANDFEQIRKFWRTDFRKYKVDELGPCRHKLSQLMTPGSTVETMLSQRENRFNFREIMDHKKILLINLSSLGSDAREIIGAFILSLFHQAALTRSVIPSQKRVPFHIYCDEAHRFIKTNAIEDLITDARKFNVSLNLANHRFSQFDSKDKTNAVSSVGSTVIFKVDSNDAKLLEANLQETVKVHDIISLERHEAIVRVGKEITRMKTLPPRMIPAQNCREEIIENSHRDYYRPAGMHKNIGSTSAIKEYSSHDKPKQDSSTSKIKEFEYDEF